MFRRKIYDDTYEIDFLLSSGDKICPVEVKSGNYRNHKSLDVFCEKFSIRISGKYVVHAKDYKRENGIEYLPVYGGVCVRESEFYDVDNNKIAY